MDFVENLIELLKGVSVGVGTAEARSSGCVASHDTKAIVHVDLEVAGKRETPQRRGMPQASI